ncbi:MAG: SsrA-binding protein [Flavobacteriales bacterium]
MRKQLFRQLARLNKALLPKLWHKDLLRLSKTQKLIVAWRIWVTKNAL